MSLKLKVLGLGILAVMATSAFAAMNASATTPINSHFVATPPTDFLKIEGTESFPGSHNLTFQRTTPDGTPTGLPIKCTHAHYHGELTGNAATTTQSVKVRPSYTNCSTNGEPPHNVVVDVPASCGTNVYEFTSGNPGTIHVNCPVTVTHPNCTIRMPEQTVSGATYHTDTTEGVHSLTVTINVKKITGHFEGGICVFLGTSHEFDMTGSATVWARDLAGNKAPITHT